MPFLPCLSRTDSLQDLLLAQGGFPDSVPTPHSQLVTDLHSCYLMAQSTELVGHTRF